MTPELAVALARPDGRQFDRSAAEPRHAAKFLRIACTGALAFPIFAAGWFIVLFSTAMPLTDEWLFLRATIALNEIGFSWSALGRIVQIFPYRIYDHHVIVPFLLYWPIAALSNFDSRALLVVTLATWAVVLLVFRYFVVRSSLWSLPIAVVLFSPARYMEFLWGFQFTLALSILFPVLGLAVLARLRPGGKITNEIGTAVVATVLIFLGALSSAGGFFGFVGAIVLLLLQRIELSHKILLLELLLAAMLLAYFVLMRDSGRVPVVNMRNLLFVLTALGSAILGMPDSFRQFAVDARSITGAAVIFFMAASIFLAARQRVLSSLALPAGIFAFSLSCVAAIAVAREYLGNWHLAYAIPAVAAAYSASYIVFRELRSPLSAQLCLTATLTLMLNLIAWYGGFSEYGPRYNAYIRTIEQYARSYLANPMQVKPFPGTAGWDLDANMVWFLASRHHRLFAVEDSAILGADRIPSPDVKLVIARSGPPDNTRAHVLLIAAVPPSENAGAVIVETGGHEIILRRTDPRLVAPVVCAGACFTGWTAAGNLPAEGAARISLVRANLR